MTNGRVLHAAVEPTWNGAAYRFARGRPTDALSKEPPGSPNPHNGTTHPHHRAVPGFDVLQDPKREQNGDGFNSRTVHHPPQHPQPPPPQQGTEANTPHPTTTHHNPTRQRMPHAMPTNPKGRAGRPWRRARSQVQGDICWLCGGPIPTLDTLRVGRYILQPWNHPLARTIHHIIELQQGGDPLDPTNLVPAHRRCNSRQRPGQPTTPPDPNQATRNSRPW